MTPISQSVISLFFIILVGFYSNKKGIITSKMNKGLVLFQKDAPKSSLKSEIKKILLNPSIIAVVIGIIIMIFNIPLANFLLSAIGSIGNMTGPLSMIIIGGILAQAKITNYLRDWTIYDGLALKLLVLPLMVHLIFSLAQEPSIAITSVVIMTAMPTSAMTSILAENFKKERDYAAVLVSLSTLLSLITVPLLLKIMTP